MSINPENIKEAQNKKSTTTEKGIFSKFFTSEDILFIPPILFLGVIVIISIFTFPFNS